MIAHRLSSIADFDKVLVTGDGNALKYGEQSLLMEWEDSAFRKLLNSSIPGYFKSNNGRSLISSHRTRCLRLLSQT